MIGELTLNIVHIHASHPEVRYTDVRPRDNTFENNRRIWEPIEDTSQRELVGRNRERRFRRYLPTQLAVL